MNVFRYQAPAQIDQSKPQYQPNRTSQARLPYNAYGEGSAFLSERTSVNVRLLYNSF